MLGRFTHFWKVIENASVISPLDIARTDIASEHDWRGG
jgi:hypothetical protein